jgi:hypothetical protein
MDPPDSWETYVVHSSGAERISGVIGLETVRQ